MLATDKTSGIQITKASGEKAAFSVDKLRNSLMHSGAEIQMADHIIEQICPQLYEGISTRKIYQMAFALLRKQSRLFAGRYHIKKGIMELGPSGFPFEKYIAGLLQ